MNETKILPIIQKIKILKNNFINRKNNKFIQNNNNFNNIKRKYSNIEHNINTEFIINKSIPLNIELIYSKIDFLKYILEYIHTINNIELNLIYIEFLGKKIVDLFTKIHNINKDIDEFISVIKLINNNADLSNLHQIIINNKLFLEKTINDITGYLEKKSESENTFATWRNVNSNEENTSATWRNVNSNNKKYIEQIGTIANLLEDKIISLIIQFENIINEYIDNQIKDLQKLYVSKNIELIYTSLIELDKLKLNPTQYLSIINIIQDNNEIEKYPEEYLNIKLKYYIKFFNILNKNISVNIPESFLEYFRNFITKIKIQVLLLYKCNIKNIIEIIKELFIADYNKYKALYKSLKGGSSYNKNSKECKHLLH